jgi:AcrR family transcriptional regulator
MSAPARTRKSARDRKAEICQTALALAFEVGPDMVTTGMIAARLGLTQPAIYKHFPRKEDIWSEVAEDLAARVGANLARSRDAACGPVARLRMLVMDHLRLVERNPALPEIMVLRDQHNIRSALRQPILRIMASFHADLVLNVKLAQEQRLFWADIDATDATALIFGIIQSLVLRMMLNRDPGILVPEGERLLTLQLAGFTRTGD